MPGCMAVVIEIYVFNIFFQRFHQILNYFFPPFSLPLYLTTFISNEENWTSSRGTKWINATIFMCVSVTGCITQP